MSEVFSLYDKINETKIEINPTAMISKSATIGENVSIGAFSIIGDHVVIEDNTIVEHNVYIASDCRVGEGSIILSGVKIGPSVSIGKNFRCSYNSVIGSDGFLTLYDQISGVWYGDCKENLECWIYFMTIRNTCS